MKKDPSIRWDGNRITKPGIYSHMNLEAYHNPDICDGPSISSSGLRDINPDRGSPAHFYAQWAGNPESTPKDTRAFVVGRAAHHLTLGQEFFAKLFAQQPEEYAAPDGELKPWNNNAKFCREWHAIKRKEGRIVLTAKEVEAVKQMAISVGNHPLVKQGLLNGLVERSLFWRDEETGIWLKARPDAIPNHSGDFADLKTTHSVMFPSVIKSIRDFAYYQQIALVRTGCREVLELEMSSFTYLFVESKAPWCTMDVQVDGEDVVRGDRMNRACLRTFAKCLKDGHWPGPAGDHVGVRRVGMSAAAREQIDNRLKHEGLADGQD